LEDRDVTVQAEDLESIQAEAAMALLPPDPGKFDHPLSAFLVIGFFV
jgi:hypothetical protein